ncbi:hypothetical protein NQD34_017287 [Periophthalmus magnuspinnatus]|nr:hypothetical protein NQD34_017287 [Periophthalmus magnuspinnatus]
MDSDLNFNSHIKSITSAAFLPSKKHCKNQSYTVKIRLGETYPAFVSSRLDDCNVLLTGLSKRTLRQNSTSRTLLLRSGLEPGSTNTCVLCSGLWLLWLRE